MHNEKPLHARVAVALKYEPERQQVPRVVAIGHGHLADKIIEQAQSHDVPIQREEVLAHALSKLQLEQSIPPELYKAVATVIRFLMSQGLKL